MMALTRCLTQKLAHCSLNTTLFVSLLSRFLAQHNTCGTLLNVTFARSSKRNVLHCRRLWHFVWQLRVNSPRKNSSPTTGDGNELRKVSESLRSNHLFICSDDYLAVRLTIPFDAMRAEKFLGCRSPLGCDTHSIWHSSWHISKPDTLIYSAGRFALTGKIHAHCGAMLHSYVFCLTRTRDNEHNPVLGEVNIYLS